MSRSRSKFFCYVIVLQHTRGVTRNNLSDLDTLHMVRTCYFCNCVNFTLHPCSNYVYLYHGEIHTRRNFWCRFVMVS